MTQDFAAGRTWGRSPTCRCCLAGRRPAPPTPRNHAPQAQPGDTPDAQHLMALAQPRLRPGRARSPRLGEQDGCVSGWGGDGRGPDGARGGMMGHGYSRRAWANDQVRAACRTGARMASVPSRSDFTEGEAPAEPLSFGRCRLGRSLALPNIRRIRCDSALALLAVVPGTENSVTSRALLGLRGSQGEVSSFNWGGTAQHAPADAPKKRRRRAQVPCLQARFLIVCSLFGPILRHALFG